MNNTSTHRLIIMAIAAAVTVAACGAEDPIGGGPYPVADLEVTVEHPDRETVSYRITCMGDAATITGDIDLDELAACTALAIPEVQRRLMEGPADQICTEQYGGPDTATIRGTIDEAPIDTIVDRVNGCGISDWDDLLADILPPAVGVTG